MDLTEIETMLDVEASQLRGLDAGQLRARRQEFEQIESALSYVRRVTQGRIDIISNELDRRAAGSGDADVVGRLPGALAGHIRMTGGTPQPPRDLQPPPLAAELEAQIDEALDPDTVASLDEPSECNLDDLNRRHQQLTAIESLISRLRQRSHQVIDVLKDELIHRYQAGSVSVDDLLR